MDENANENVFATVTVVTADGVKIKFDTEDEGSDKIYKCNAMQLFKAGDRVRIKEDSGSAVIEYVVGAPAERYPIPSGGSAGQQLVKDGSTDYALKWVNGIPTGGTSGQVLSKSSNSDYALQWSDVGNLPTGGSKGQVLVKSSASNYAVAWVDGIPTGGSTGQVLTKNSGTDYDLKWDSPSASALKNSTYTLTMSNTGVLTPNSSGSISLGSTSYPIGNLYASGTLQLGTSSYLSKLGFFGATPIAKKTSITTSSTLAALIQALKDYGLF